ncbi:MAG: hypothetical protein ACW98D_20655 [Promethearchaeota archaeon]|jgi:hypothetical protein
MNDEEKKQINVRDWITLSTVMIGAVLTILALIWQVPPASGGIGTATFLLMLSFILFVNSVSANSKANFEMNLDNTSESRVQHFVTFAEYTFGLGFTFVIAGFTILGYKYLLFNLGRTLVTLMLPLTFLITAWVMILIYNIINYSGKALKAVRSLKRNLWIILELLCLVVIFFDFFNIFSIP